MFFKDTRTIGPTCHLMVDLETLATHAASPILAIGAVLFDPTTRDTWETLHKRSILLLVDPADAVRTCGPVDGDTLKWWFSQPDEAIKRLVTGEARALRTCLTTLWEYCRPETPTHIWARSPDFDCTILQSACKATGVTYPFPFWNQRCVRTAQDLAFPNGDAPKMKPPSALKHDARDDAIVQVFLVQACYAELGLSAQQNENKTNSHPPLHQSASTPPDVTITTVS